MAASRATMSSYTFCAVALRHFVQCGGGPVQRVGEDDKLGSGAGRVLGIDSLVYARDRNRGISVVFRGSIDGVLVPGAIRQSLRSEKIFFRLPQQIVLAGEIAVWILLSGQRLLTGIAKFAGGGQSGSEVKIFHSGAGGFF